MGSEEEREKKKRKRKNGSLTLHTKSDRDKIHALASFGRKRRRDFAPETQANVNININIHTQRRKEYCRNRRTRSRHARRPDREEAAAALWRPQILLRICYMYLLGVSLGLECMAWKAPLRSRETSAICHQEYSLCASARPNKLTRSLT